MKTYYIHPAAFGSTQDPGHGHVPVVKADEAEKLRAKLEVAEKRIAELESDLSEWTNCKHDGATYYDMSGRERCGRCGADI